MVFRHAAGENAGKLEIEGRIQHETPKAVLFDDGRTVAWLSKRFVKVAPLRDGRVSVVMPEWLAKGKAYV